MKKASLDYHPDNDGATSVFTYKDKKIWMHRLKVPFLTPFLTPTNPMLTLFEALDNAVPFTPPIATAAVKSTAVCPPSPCFHAEQRCLKRGCTLF